MNLWPHQTQALADCRNLYLDPIIKRWSMVAPPGAGKSLIMEKIASPASAKGLHVRIYSHRIMLTRQLIKGFKSKGVRCGVVASGFRHLEDPQAFLQICSLPTVYSRLNKLTLPNPDLYIVDEAHQQTGEMAQAVFDQHDNSGAQAIGFTATPVNLKGRYDKLVQAASFKDLLACGAHLPIKCYGPDRPDLSKLRPMKSGEISAAVDRKLNKVPTIIGRVYEYWKKLNPNALPAIGFAPGVGESKWFVHEFQQRGVPCAHIDADRVMLVEPNSNGVLIAKEYETSEASRQAVIDGSKSGQYKIVWNRFVLREAIDMPWLFQAISATTMGALSTYLQSVGRVMRNWPGYDHVILQDHGGNIDRHGTPAEEREWFLGCTNNTLHKQEVKDRQQKKGDDAEPICCPKCSAFRLSGNQCPNCGWMHKRSIRMVRQIDGTLIRKVGRMVKHKPAKTFDDYYRSAIYSCWYTGQTVKQAYKIAKTRAASAGVAPVSNMFTPPVGDQRWHRSVREVYPKMKPKHFKGGRF